MICSAPVDSALLWEVSEPENDQAQQSALIDPVATVRGSDTTTAIAYDCTTPKPRLTVTSSMSAIAAETTSLECCKHDKYCVHDRQQCQHQ